MGVAGDLAGDDRGDHALEGPQTIAAFILETVVGTNGILVPPDGYLQGVRALCDKYGILMIADEVMAGFGRTGEWFAGRSLESGAGPDLWRRALPRATCLGGSRYASPHRAAFSGQGILRRIDLQLASDGMRGCARNNTSL